MRLAGFISFSLSGNVAAQIVSVLTLPLLAGFYGPGAIGSAYLIISVATVLVAIGLLGLDQAVVVHKDEHLAVTTALSAGAGVTLVIVIFCLLAL